MRLIVAITGASGAILGIRLLERLREADVETHLVISRWGRGTIKLETDYAVEDVMALASSTYSEDAQAAPIASGSFRVDGMIVMPCSVKTLAAIRIGLAATLITRAADVMLKERKRLVLAVRETPLSEIHLDNMVSLTRIGATILPPMPGFYLRPATVDDLVDDLVSRALDQFEIATTGARRWTGP